MRPTFMGFETATRGIMANQKAIDIVAHNTTNIGVDGYTRQRVDLVSMSMNTRQTRYTPNTTSFAGQGVNTYGVSQIRDPFLDKRFREEFSDVGYYGTVSSVLSDISTALDEISPSNISRALSNFEAAWKAMEDPANIVTNAANVRASAEQIVSVFQQMDKQLENVWNQQDYNLALQVNDVNSILERIADLNEEIYRQEYNTLDPSIKANRPLELLDQRNVLLDQLSGYLDFTYREEENGMISVEVGGHKVVDGGDYKKMGKKIDSSDERYKTASLYWEDSGEDIQVTKGALLANLHMLNGRGVDVKGGNESVEEGILYFREKIDQFAVTFAKEFNNVIELEDGSGFKTLFVFDPDYEENASNIRVSSEWLNNPAYLYEGIKDKDEEGNLSTSFAGKVAQIFKNDLEFGEFTGKFQDYIMFYSVSKLGNNQAYADSRLEAVTDVSETIMNQIEEVSGVSFEEEAIDMMMYKKAYDAVSRVFTTMDEMLDKLINGTGVVGR